MELPVTFVLPAAFQGFEFEGGFRWIEASCLSQKHCASQKDSVENV